MAASERLTVEVAYALPQTQRVVAVPFEEGMTAAQAVEHSGLPEDCPELAGRKLDLGIYGRMVRPDHVLRAGDRVEVYRPLRADPRETRRRLAAAGRSMGRPGSGSGR
jgi:hypothetical protein